MLPVRGIFLLVRNISVSMMNDSLIRKYFNGECSQEEAESIVRYLKDHPEILSEYMTEDDWERFVPKEKWLRGEDIWTTIAHEAQLYAPKKKRIFLWVAAIIGVVVLLIGGSYLLQKKDTSTFLTDDATVLELHQNDTIRNKGMQDMVFLLPDSTVVTLCPQGELRFSQIFDGGKRDVFLTGKAKFKVFKDKTRPFSVFAGSTVTTALGTVFWVDQSLSSKKVNVQLLEGKVVIKKYEKGNVGDVLTYLIPGENYAFDPTIKNKNLVKDIVPKHKHIASKETIKDGKIEQPLAFDKCTADKVLDSVASVTNVKIVYPKSAFQNIIYTGVYNPKTSNVNRFLQEMCLLNGWQLTELGSSQFSIEIAK